MRLLLVAALVFAGCSERDGVRVFAAASLADVLTEIAADYERATGEHVVFNFASSNALARQIDRGAPADVFISADEAKMAWLAERQQIVAATRVRLLSNRLVLVVGRDDRMINAPRDLVRARTLALAETSAVPAGVYARQWLESLGIWTAVAARVVPTENVRAALYAVETGNADAAIVYATDARTARNVRVAHEVVDGPPIAYVAAITASAERPEAAQRFLTYLRSDTAAEVYRRHGFTTVDAQCLLPACREKVPRSGG